MGMSELYDAEVFQRTLAVLFGAVVFVSGLFLLVVDADTVRKTIAKNVIAAILSMVGLSMFAAALSAIPSPVDSCTARTKDETP